MCSETSVSLELIAYTVDRLDAPGSAVKGDLLPDALDVCIDGTVISAVIKSPNGFEDLFSLIYLTRVGSKKIKDLNFLGSAGNCLALDLNGIVAEVDLKTGELKDGRSLLCISETAENGLDPRDYLTGREGLYDIVVGT